MMRRRYELTDKEWLIIEPLLPNKPRGVPRVDDRRVLNGILWRFRSGAPWAEIPERYGPSTTCYNRFVRWRMAGIWDLIMEAFAEAHDSSVQMIDTSIVRVHQHGGCAGDGGRTGAGITPMTPTRVCWPLTSAPCGATGDAVSVVMMSFGGGGRLRTAFLAAPC
jgi:transposase